MTAATKRWSAPLPQVDLQEMLRYAACRAPDEQTLALATQCAAEGEKVLRPALCWREVPLAVRENEVDLGFTRFGSRKLADALRGCERAVVFGATVGLVLDRLIARYGRISPSRGLMMQALGAERIEALCDAFVTGWRRNMRPGRCGRGSLPATATCRWRGSGPSLTPCSAIRRSAFISTVAISCHPPSR